MYTSSYDYMKSTYGVNGVKFELEKTTSFAHDANINCNFL